MYVCYDANDGSGDIIMRILPNRKGNFVYYDRYILFYLLIEMIEMIEIECYC